MPTALSGTATLAYEVAGEGMPVLLLLPQSTGPAGRVALHNGLAAQHRVVRYDQRGTGASSPSSTQLTMAQQAADALAVLDHAGIERAHLFCHSTGCGIGLALAATYPHRVARLCLTNPWTHGDTHLHTMQHLRIAAAKALDATHYAQFNAALLFPPDFRREHAQGFAQQAARAPEHPQDAQDIAQRLQAILAFDARPLLPDIHAPTLVMGARDDQLMPHWFARDAAASLPDATLVVLDDGGHMLPETRPVHVLDAVLRHFEAQR